MTSNDIVTSAATAQLLDGRVISLRRLTVDDSESALALHQHLSDHDRYFRFTLNPTDLNELVSTMTEPAYGRCALGAFDGDRLIGVAHYALVGEHPKVAEIAVVVAHEDHSIGVGTALLKCLAQIARTEGIERFDADVLGDNHLMLMMLLDLGWTCEPIYYGSTRHLEMELPGLAAHAQATSNALSELGLRNVKDHNKAWDPGVRRRVGRI